MRTLRNTPRYLVSSPKIKTDLNVPFFQTDNIDAMDQTYQLRCNNPYDTMKVGGVFQYDLKELQYDCDKRYSHT